MDSPRHILLTGLPGCGKTTLVRRVIEPLTDLRLAGFYTGEPRGTDGRRVGFEAIGLNDGQFDKKQPEDITESDWQNLLPRLAI